MYFPKKVKKMFIPDTSSRIYLVRAKPRRSRDPGSIQIICIDSSLRWNDSLIEFGYRIGDNGCVKITVRVKPRSKKESVTKAGDGVFRVAVKDPANEGRANNRLIELLSKHFDVPKSRISIVSGETSRIKIVEVLR